VATAFAVSVETVNRWAEDGKLPGYRLPSGRWRFHAEDIEHILAGERTG
jgi:excisionase family DNA binding protein